MAHRTHRNANVAWWDSSSMYVRCPHCADIHQHGFEGKYEVEQYRVPHCGNPESYRICFPSNGLYEIDKSRGLYIRAGADPTKYFARFDSVSPVDVSGRRKWTEAEEEVDLDEYHRNKLQRISDAFGAGPIGEVERCNRLQIAVSDMILGRVQAVRTYLETSLEKDIFLHGVEAFETRRPDIDEWDAYHDLDDKQRKDVDPPQMKIVETTSTGGTALHKAACEIYPEMVKLLLDFGADPNAKTVSGRTPLMEAAIWGRLNNVRYLISYGASQSVRCMRNGESLRALDFARDTSENSEERYFRSGGEHQVYKEVTHERNKDRAAIIRELSDETVGDNQSGQALSFNLQGFVFTPIIDGSNIVSMITNFDIPQSRKTVGILLRSSISHASAFPPVAAMSGWGHEPDLELNVQIAGRTWTDEVFRIYRTIEHELPVDGYDQGIPGRFHACHVEKQLIAYFVSKHIFLAEDVESEDFGMSTLSFASQTHWEGRDRLAELQRIQPSQRLQKATILVSRAICSDCNFFVRRANEALMLNIELQNARPYTQTTELP